jgi:hydroxymethylglutaryl-CoA lyase
MIRIAEMAARDGLQNESRSVPTAVKIAFIDALSATGVQEIEASSFVAAGAVPQLQDAEQVFAGIRRAPGVVYSALVPNERGLERAVRSKVDKIAVFTAASETFNRNNINASIDESFERFAPVVRQAKAAGLPIRGYISTAFWCPFEGAVSPGQTVVVARRLLDLGVDEVSVGDTIGKAVPSEVLGLLDLLLPFAAADRLAMHFHDTYHHAIENVIASRRRGIATFDASAGGIGGCPYAPGASGNVATEAVVQALRQEGEEVGVDLEALQSARNVIAAALGRSIPG